MIRLCWDTIRSSHKRNVKTTALKQHADENKIHRINFYNIEITDKADIDKQLRLKEIFHIFSKTFVSGLWTSFSKTTSYVIEKTSSTNCQSEGYKRLIVITEYLIKYPYVAPIKSKTATEIARKLLDFIALFGPPKLLLSDQGTEFNNFDELLKKVATEHRVTAPFSPRTNGQTERFNKVFVEALARVTSENHLDWQEWIPLNFRSKIHSSTGYTPN